MCRCGELHLGQFSTWTYFLNSSQALSLVSWKASFIRSILTGLNHLGLAKLKSLNVELQETHGTNDPCQISGIECWSTGAHSQKDDGSNYDARTIEPAHKEKHDEATTRTNPAVLSKSWSI